MTGGTDDFTGATGDGDAQGPVRCPHCGSRDTRVEQRKGTSLCRTMYYCNSCSQPFEDFGSPSRSPAPDR